jgi:hypothetical protein
MSIYFFGDVKDMTRVRDETLMSKLGYKDTNLVPNRGSIISPDDAIILEFGSDRVKVCINDESMLNLIPAKNRKNGAVYIERYTEKARPYLEELKKLLNPRIVLDSFNEDITDTLGIE